MLYQNHWLHNYRILLLVLSVLFYHILSCFAQFDRFVQKRAVQIKLLTMKVMTEDVYWGSHLIFPLPFQLLTRAWRGLFCNLIILKDRCLSMTIYQCVLSEHLCKFFPFCSVRGSVRFGSCQETFPTCVGITVQSQMLTHCCWNGTENTVSQLWCETGFKVNLKLLQQHLKLLCLPPVTRPSAPFFPHLPFTPVLYISR